MTVAWLGTLSITEANDTLAGAGIALPRPFLLRKAQRPPPGYTPSPLPLLDGGDSAYTQHELLRLKSVLDTYLLMLPQVATSAPTQLLDGMQRLARSPWWPASGQVADAWVYYDLPSSSWLFL